MILDLPIDLQNLICIFSFNATLAETRDALTQILELKQIHPWMKKRFVHDYSDTGAQLYDRKEKSLGFLGYFLSQPLIKSPFEEFFVWFDLFALFDITHISRLTHDLDWRRVRFIARETGHKSKHTFLCWVFNTIEGIRYFSELIQRLEPWHLRKYPSSESRRLLGDDTVFHDLWLALIY